MCYIMNSKNKFSQTQLVLLPFKVTTSFDYFILDIPKYGSNSDLMMTLVSRKMSSV